MAGGARAFRGNILLASMTDAASGALYKLSRREVLEVALYRQICGPAACLPACTARRRQKRAAAAAYLRAHTTAPDPGRRRPAGRRRGEAPR